MPILFLVALPLLLVPGARTQRAEGPKARIEQRGGEVAYLTIPAEGGAAHDWLGGEQGGVRLEIEGVPTMAEHVRTARFVTLTLANGDLLLGELKGGHDERVFVELLGESVVELSIDEVHSLVFPTRAESDAGPLAAPSEGDRLYWRKAGSLDRLDGAVTEFRPEGVGFESVLGAKTFPWEEIAALYVEAFEEERPTGAGGAARVVTDLFDGSRLRGGLVGIDAAGLGLRRDDGSELRLPLGAIAEVIVDDGSVAYLSSMAPAEVVEGSPFGDDLGMVWPHRVDRSVTGGPLQVGGRRYTRGLGVHAPSRLTWQLDGKWKALRGAVALDDQVLRLPARGSVRFRVLVDDDVRWESPVVRGGDGAIEMGAVDLSGASRLTLEVDMATDLHLGDRADWLRVLLER